MMRCSHCRSPLPTIAKFCGHCGRPVEVREDPWIGKLLLGKYRCLEAIGEGGLATVYKAQHGPLAQFRALKVLRAEFRDDSRARDSLWREARTAGSFRHPNVAIVHDFDTLPYGTPCSVWEMIEGQTLGERVGRAPLGASTSAVIRSLCDALEVLHERGLSHLDLSPENVMLCAGREGLEARLIDFGETRMDGRPGPRAESLRAGFAAPEQFDDARLPDARADIFALGNLILFAYCGRSAFEASELAAYRREIDAYDPQLFPVVATLPDSLRRVVTRCLSREPSGRPKDAAELRDEIRRAARDTGRIRSPDVAVAVASEAVARGASTAVVPSSDHGAVAPQVPSVVETPARSPDVVERDDTVAPAARSITDTELFARPEPPPPAANAHADGLRGVAAVTMEDETTLLTPEVAPEAVRIATPSRARLEPCGGRSATPFVLAADTTIGRDPDNALRIDVPTVSKRHAIIHFEGSDYVVTDLGSSNGTTVNGRELAGHKALRDGDEVSFGAATFIFRRS